MQNNSFSLDKPDHAFELFQKGLDELATYKYAAAVHSFTQALTEYERQNGPKEDKIYPTLRFFSEWSQGLAAYARSDFTQAIEAFARAQEVITTGLGTKGAGQPEPTLKALLPTLDFFLKIIPLDERLKEILSQPRDLNYLADELEGLFEPLSDLMIKAAGEGAPPEVYTLWRAKVNICAVLLYLLGRLHLPALVGVMRHQKPDRFKDEPGRVIQWVLTQEQTALLEIGFDPAQEIIPAVSHFAKEILGLGAPQKLQAIPEQTRAQLLTLLSPLSQLDGGLSRQYFLEPVVKRSVETFKQLFENHETRLATLLKNQPVQDTTHRLTAKFPTPPDAQWIDLTLQFIDRETIKASIKERHRRLNYVEFGFKDERRALPNTHWQTLKDLAENHGALSWRTRGAGKRIPKSIQFIRQRLKAVFNLPDDPFFPYRQVRAYKTKFKIEDISPGAGPFPE